MTGSFVPRWALRSRPHGVRELRERLRRSWRDAGTAVPRGFWRWPRARLWAVWFEMRRRRAGDGQTGRTCPTGRTGD